MNAPEQSTPETQPNHFNGVRLIPWNHKDPLDLAKLVERVGDVKEGKNISLSIDSLRPSQLRISDTVPVDTVLYSLHKQIVDKIPDLVGSYLIGSDPMLLSNIPMIENIYKHLGKHAFNLEEFLIKGLVSGSALVLGEKVYSESRTSEMPNKGEADKYNQKTTMSRRDFLGTLLGVGIGIAGAAINPIPSEIITLKDFFPDTGDADKVHEGKAHGKLGNIGNTQGIDERTLLDIYKQEYARKVIAQSEGVDVNSISVWGTSHFLTDDYKNFEQLLSNEDMKTQLIKDSQSLLDRIFPTVRDFLLERNYATKDEITKIFLDAKRDIYTVSITKVLKIEDRYYLEPVVLPGNSGNLYSID